MAATSRRGLRPGRLDPTVRALLRAFLSPAIADRYASALQPIAVADRDAALAGAVSTLRARFFVPTEELAVALVEDAGWDVADVSTMLGLSTLAIRAELRADAEGARPPRITANAPEPEALTPEAELVEAMLAPLPTRRRDASEAAAAAADEPVDVELATRLPAHAGQPSLEARIARADRLQRIGVNGTIAAIVVLVALAVVTTQPPTAEETLPDDEVVALDPGPSGTPSADPEPDTATAAPDEALPVGPLVVEDARFVASVDPVTGEPGRTLSPARPQDDPRLWLRLAQLPSDEVLLDLSFTAPSGRSTVRPVLVTERISIISVRLPDELGRAPGRYAAVLRIDDTPRLVVELDLVEDEPDADADAG